MATVNDMMNQVRKYLDKEGWEYECNEEKKVILTGVSIEAKLKSVKMFVAFKENGYLVYAVSPITADEKTRPAVMEYITRANYGMRNGNFEMDLHDGDVRYKVYVPTEGLDVIPDYFIENSIMLPPTMFKRYGDGMVALMMGFSDPETEIKKAES